MIKYYCDSCGKGPLKHEIRYVMRLEIFAAPEVSISKEDLNKDYESELKNLYAQLEKIDTRTITDQVYVKHTLDLCQRCRNKLYQRINCREFV